MTAWDLTPTPEQQVAVDDIELANTARMAYLSWCRRKLGIPNLIILPPTPPANHDRLP